MKGCQNEQTTMWIFFDDIICEYLTHYGTQGEKILAKDLEEYLPDFSKNSQVIVLTRKNPSEVFAWLSNHKLNPFVYAIKNPEFK